MWMLSFIPDVMIHAMALIGVLGIIAGFLLGFIPFISNYKLPIQVISIILLAFGLYMEGGIANEESWRQKVKDAEVRAAQAEAKSGKENVKIVYKVVTKTNTIREQGKDRIQYIDRVITKYDSACTIPTEVITVLNSAAQNKPLVGTKP